MINNHTHSITVKHLSSKTIQEIPLPLPSRREQERIIAKLDSLCARSKAASDELARIPLLIEHYKQAILEKVFQRAVQEAETNIELGAIAVEVRNGLSRRPENYPPGVPILKISAIRSMAVRLDERRYYVLESGEDISRYQLKIGDLLFTRYNGNPSLVANCGIIRKIDENIVYPDKLIRVRLDTNAATPSFIECLMASQQIRSALSPSIKSAAGQHGISGADLKKIVIPLPSIQAQQRIIETLEAELSWLAGVEAEGGKAIHLLNHLDQGLLAKAFRGELVPQDPSDEPAEKLLERIRATRGAQPRTRRGRRARAGAAA